MQNFQFYLPTKVYFGLKASENVGKETKILGKKALIVTGKNSARKTGLLQRVEKSLNRAEVEFHELQTTGVNKSRKTAYENISHVSYYEDNNHKHWTYKGGLPPALLQ